METKLNKLDSIEERLNKYESKFCAVDVDMKSCKDRISTLEHSAQFMSDIKDEHQAIKKKLDKVSESIETSKTVNLNVKNRLVDFEKQNFSSNLLFFAIDGQIEVTEMDTGINGAKVQICICVLFIYMPPDNNVFNRKIDLDVFEVLQEQIEHYSVLGNIAVIGNHLNGRIGLENDFIMQDNLNVFNCNETDSLNHEPDLQSKRTTEDIKIANSFGLGDLAIYSDSPKYSFLDKLYHWVQNGGRGKPSTCYPRHRVAIIIPYRNRESHLRTFLYNIHPILNRQELDYGIYVVEQNGGSKFNRAMLMNIGYAEAMKIHDYQCFVFHDVDLIPENDKNIYNCPKQPRHMSVAVDKFKYRLPYNSLFGGVSSLTKEQFQKVNGFPNRYFGWGCEDDDMWRRIKNAGYKVIRYAREIARYKMIKHGTDTGNKANPGRFKMLKDSKKYFKTDGINSLKYKVLKIDFNHLYTRVVVDIDEKEVMAVSRNILFIFMFYI
ncbi:beta-1,4-N-acetylgalactosaminyltransferase bre-4-like [Mytilus edulis]|uniref:beta-1,4-N-acetylgalactosaminyltransferase bre-4-like n=1 Tax=Mytilus edulis TaxID=6550 RepID=UPI0039F04D7B